MTIAEINMTDKGSTGKIMFSIAEVARQESIKVITFSPYPFSKSYHKLPKARELHFYYGSWFERKIDNVLGRIFGLNGLNCIWGTLELIHIIKKNRADLIHLHNLHGYCINLPILFWFINRNNIKVIWTLHDCWTFTGHCPHFTMIGCNKWKTGCRRCPQYRDYPQSLIDSSKLMWIIKRKLFTSVRNMTFVTPSQWLADLVKQSFLKEYPVKVIRNGIDLAVFKPTPSNIRDDYKISNDKFIIVGVAFGWGERKGLDVFVELSKRLDCKRYQIILVGTDDKTDKQLPDSIISIHRTQNQRELAQIYSAADLFVNPTREDNYPTVNMEAIACGTPVLTFRTGGSPEIISYKTGCIVDCNDVDAMEKEIIRICVTKSYNDEELINHSKSFDMNAKYKEYVNLYLEILK